MDFLACSSRSYSFSSAPPTIIYLHMFILFSPLALVARGASFVFLLYASNQKGANCLSCPHLLNWVTIVRHRAISHDFHLGHTRYNKKDFPCIILRFHIPPLRLVLSWLEANLLYSLRILANPFLINLMSFHLFPSHFHLFAILDYAMSSPTPQKETICLNLSAWFLVFILGIIIYGISWGELGKTWVILERKTHKNELRSKISFVYNRKRMKKNSENKQKPDKGKQKRERGKSQGT